MHRIEMHLTDGRVIDLTGLSPDDVFEKLAFEGVTPALIRETRHYVDTTLPSYRCPRCGRVSYHPQDLANRYCGFCHQFEEP